MILTIVTPTYNRQNNLKILFDSLQKQTCKKFKWLVIDDGSTDGTNTLFAKFEKLADFSIQYIYQENMGKHGAYNTAIELLGNTGYHVVVDSDDYLADDAVEIMRNDLKRIKTHKDMIGIVYPRTSLYSQTEWLPDGVTKVDIPEIKFLYNLNIETCIIISNAAVSVFRFPIFEKETFMSEESLYYFLASKGKFLPLNKIVYYFEYLDDGLTKNVFSYWKRNVEGTLFSLKNRKKYINAKLRGIKKVKELIKVTLNINAMYFIKKDFTQYSILDFIIFPIVWMFYLIRFK